MILEIHDTEEGNTLSGRVNNIDYDYVAEQWVQDIYTDEINGRHSGPPLAKFILLDDDGQRAVWIITPDGVQLTERSDRFTGEWQQGIPYIGRR